MCEANNTVGLTGLLGVLVDLLNNLRLSMDSMPDMVQASASTRHPFVSCGSCVVDTKEKVIPVDLSEMAEFIAVVQNRFVFLTCVSRCQLQFIGQPLSLQETLISHAASSTILIGCAPHLRPRVVPQGEST